MHPAANAVAALRTIYKINHSPIITCAVLMATIIVVLLIDVTNGNIGFVRY